MGTFLFDARRNHTLQIGDKIVAGGHLIRLAISEAEAKLHDERLKLVNDDYEAPESPSLDQPPPNLDPVASQNESVTEDSEAANQS
jgi:hypothetical protein